MEDDYDVRLGIVNVLSVLFCELHGYPYDAFMSCMDYNGDFMIYCTALFPLPEKYEALKYLTREKYEKELCDFLSVLEGEEIQYDLEVCEEYIKE